MNRLKLMYITNDPKVSEIAQAQGVDRIFVDMEYIGKDLRQKGMDTVQSHHTVEDVKAIRKVITKSELLVRCNPVHDASELYNSTEEEIDEVVGAGADIIMLPYFKTATEVERFIKAVDGRAKTMLLFETPESYENADEILELDGIDEVYIGLNDMSLGFGMKFMFQLLADGFVDNLSAKFKKYGYPFGFGGIAKPGGNVPLPAERIIKEHYRLGSTCVILSRSFCNAENVSIDELEARFKDGVDEVRKVEDESERLCKENFDVIEKNREEITEIVQMILNK